MLELNTLYNMNCMNGMKEFPDNYFELAIVDPPYGQGSITYMPGKRSAATGGYIDEYDITIATLDVNQRRSVKVNVVHGNTSDTTLKHFGDSNVSPSPEYFKELFRVSRNQIIWGGNYFMLPPSRGFIVWKKTNVPENFTMAMCEFAWMSFNTNAKIVDFNGQGTKKNPRIHPTQKPVALYKWILDKYAKQGDKILDTHVGSASSLIACHELGYEFIGFEIDSAYYEAASHRLEICRAQLDLGADVRLP